MTILKSPAVQTALVVAMATGGWWVLNRVNLNFAQLPVAQVEQVSSDTGASVMPSLFPVWVTPRVKKVAQQPAASVDEAFAQSPATQLEEEQEALAPDYAETLKPAIKVQGTTDSGVFLNGRFYAVGAEIGSLSFVGVDGLQVTPRVVAVSDRRLVIGIAGESLTLINGGGGWE